MNWTLVTQVGLFLITALTTWLAYRKWHVERKDSMASTIQKLAASTENLVERIGNLEAENTVLRARVRELEGKLGIQAST